MINIYGSQTHVLKWVDAKGYINIAFQVLRSQPLDRIKNVNYSLKNTSCSLVFSQNNIFNISISILRTAPKASETKTREDNLGTYSFDDLNETVIIQKFDEFINSIAA